MHGFPVQQIYNNARGRSTLFPSWVGVDLRALRRLRHGTSTARSSAAWRSGVREPPLQYYNPSGSIMSFSIIPQGAPGRGKWAFCDFAGKILRSAEFDGYLYDATTAGQPSCRCSHRGRPSGASWFWTPSVGGGAVLWSIIPHTGAFVGNARGRAYVLEELGIIWPNLEKPASWCSNTGTAMSSRSGGRGGLNLRSGYNRIARRQF